MLDSGANLRHVDPGLDERLTRVEDVVDARVTVTVNREMPAFPRTIQRDGREFLRRHVGQAAIVPGAEVRLPLKAGEPLV